MKGAPVVLGIRANWRLFALLVIVNLFVGMMVGVERTLVPILGQEVFLVGSKAALLSFIATFGVVKAIFNLLAGSWSEALGRRRVLIAGWIVGLPVPLLLMFAPPPHWWIIVAANVLLGVNQGLCWTMTLVLKVDIAGEERRGLAAGLNEFAGYASLAVAAFATGYLAATFGIRPIPFLIGLAAAVAGLAISVAFVPETVQVAHRRGSSGFPRGGPLRSLWRLSFQERRMIPFNQAGLFNNFNDGVVWGLFPILFTAALSDTSRTGVLVALYPLTWGVTQLGTGPLSDRIGRKWLISWGLLLQGIALYAVTWAPGYSSWAVLMVLLGVGTAMAYPTLIGAVGDLVAPETRATALGVYRFWRDLGSAAGALSAGFLADLAGLGDAISVTAVLTLASGLVVAFSVRESRSVRGPHPAGVLPPGGMS